MRDAFAACFSFILSPFTLFEKSNVDLNYMEVTLYKPFSKRVT
jgi:hypothetical protein